MLPDVKASAGELYDELAEMLLGDPDRWTPDVRRSVSASRARGAGVLDAVGGGSDATHLAAASFLAELLAGLWIDRRWTREVLDRVIARVADAANLDVEVVRFTIFIRTIRDRQLFELPPQLAVETHLAILAELAPIADVSLWTAGAAQAAIVAGNGASGSSRRARAAAAAAIGRDTVLAGKRSLLHALPVRGFDRPVAAIVVRVRPELRERALAYGRETTYVLGPLLEIDSLLQRNADRERSLVESSERRLVRVGFDLHDGPLQDIAALAQDVRLYRSQLPSFLRDDDSAGIALGRVDDLEARLMSLDRDVREIAGSLQSPTVLRLPFTDAVERELTWFRRETQIDPDVETNGDFGELTSSQKIALLRVLHEALSNVRDHSNARNVRIRISADQRRISAQVVDDGMGFDVAGRLVEAARGGRLGLVGMGERIRLLGGRFEIESEPGSGTTVRAVIPRWKPLDESGGTV